MRGTQRLPERVASVVRCPPPVLARSRSPASSTDTPPSTSTRGCATTTAPTRRCWPTSRPRTPTPPRCSPAPQDLQERIFAEIKGRVQETDLSVPERDGAWWHYSRTIEGEQYSVHCRLAAGSETDPPDPDDPDVRAAEQVVLDGNAEAGDDDYFALGVFDYSPDDTVLAWAADRNGSERYTLRFRDLATGQDRTLARRFPRRGHRRLLLHGLVGRRSPLLLHRDPTRPPARTRSGATCWARPSPTTCWSTARTTSGSSARSPRPRTGAGWCWPWAPTITSELRVCRTDDATAAFVTVAPRRQGIEADLEHAGRHLLSADQRRRPRLPGGLHRVGRRAGRRRLGSGAWQDVVPHSPGVRLEQLDVLARPPPGRGAHRGHRPGSGCGGWPRARSSFLDQPEEVSAISLAENHDMHWPQLRSLYTSLVTPADGDRPRPRHRRASRPQGAAGARRLRPGRLRVPPAVGHRGRRHPDPGQRRPPPRPAARRPGRCSTATAPTRSPSIPASPSPGSRCSTAAGPSPSATSAAAARWVGAGTSTASSTPRPTRFDDLIACRRAADRRRRGRRSGRHRRSAAARPAACSWAPRSTGPRSCGRRSWPRSPSSTRSNTILDPSLPLTVIEWEEWGNPVESRRSSSVMAGVHALREHPRRAAAAGAGHRRPPRPTGRLLGAGEVGGPAARRRRRHRRAGPVPAARPRWAPATAGRRVATTPGRTRRWCSPSCSTPSGARARSEPGRLFDPSIRSPSEGAPPLTSHPELAAEQAYVDHAYDCLESARDRARGSADDGRGRQGRHRAGPLGAGDDRGQHRHPADAAGPG